jgi:valyl-tRNA synthetase
MKHKPTLDLSEKHYKPEHLEQVIYKTWKDQKAFAPDPSSNKKRFSVAIPPPNVTGRLHMGHALNNSVQDSLCRYKRMDGYDVLWVPGTDHAGISTQSVVKKHLDAEGVDFYSLGRAEAINKIWTWKEKYGHQILNQLERLGCSCSWDHTSFTMDENLSTAVKVAFKKLYDDGLIYRGKYIVNWCPVDKTALSDDEVDTKEGGEPGFLWHVKYALENSDQFVTIATTRPETILGDSAIAVNPTDERYKNLIGKNVSVPLCNRLIPIIADDYVDKDFGSGCLKVTPAHDINDFQLGQRHKLPQINVMNPDATMGDQAPIKYHGLDRFACRELIIKELTSLGQLEKIEERMTPVGRAQRSGAIIEYRLSDQWFVKMEPLAKAALKKSDSGDLKLFPERWDAIYRHWLENTRDWCISRQIWWGHQIPAWYNKSTGEILVDVKTPNIVLKNPDEWIQDEDVLDTWFSSALWPYSTLGWPENTVDLRTYYPTSVLSTAKDIIYFWVARMVMTGVHFLNEVPFKEVYFHPVICDHKGETMSKSKGNGIDPIHVIEGATVETLEGPIRDARPQAMETMLKDLHSNFPNGFEAVGADALRVTLLSLNSQAQQVQLSLKKFDEVGRKLIDKFWNASRFVLSKLSEGDITYDDSLLGLEDKWILGRLDQTTKSLRESIESYKFHEGINAFTSFFWDDFCDWYLEISKSRLKEKEGKNASHVRAILFEVLDSSIKLIHPIAPFISEELFAHLNTTLKTDENKFLCEHQYPTDKERFKPVTDKQFSLMQDVIRSTRNIRSELGLSAGKEVPVLYKAKSKEIENLLTSSRERIVHLASLSCFDSCTSKPAGFLSTILSDVELYLDIAKVVDINLEIERLEKQIQKIDKDEAGLNGRLQNPKFIERAPEEVVLEAKAELSALKDKKKKIEDTIVELRG